MSAFVLLAAWLIAYLAIRRLARAWAQDWLAVGVLALATVGFFWRVLFAAGWMPAGGGDMAPFLYPNYRFAAASLKRGVIPLWNPYLYGGMPFAADIQSGLFYPPNLALFLLWPEITYRTLEHLAIFHFFLAGVFMYFCLRGLSENGQESLSRPSALAGAVAFMFSDLFVVHFGNLNMIAVAAWLPLVFLLFHRALAGRRISLAAERSLAQLLVPAGSPGPGVYRRRRAGGVGPAARLRDGRPHAPRRFELRGGRPLFPEPGATGRIAGARLFWPRPGCLLGTVG
jgi:hypothetical protein